MAAFANLTAALAALGTECVVLKTGEVALLASINMDGRVECPAGFYMELSEVGQLPTVSSIALVMTPTSVSLSGSKTSTGVVTATYSDGSTGVVPATLVSGTPAVASVDGLVATGLTVGTSSIVANFAGKVSAGVTLTVTA